ncbi:MAG: hypothetical protein Q9221_008003 [Calogaya cf. arnoldii]
MADRQKKLVKYIWLGIELPTYDDYPIKTGLPDHYSDIVGEAIRSLYDTLSRWPRTEDLVLDIEANDAQGTVICHDLCHSCTRAEQTIPPTEKAVGVYEWRFHQIELTGDVWRVLEKVRAVTGLLLRRQTRRAWEPASLRAVIGRLTGLQELYYEPWREWEQVFQQDRDSITQVIFKLFSSDELKRLVLFEDFDDHHDAAFEDFPYYLDAEPVRTPDVAFSEARAEASLKLEHLSASFNVEAKWFLQASQPS